MEKKQGVKGEGNGFIYAMIWVAVLVAFGLLYMGVRRAIVNEVRQQAMGVAIAVSEALDVTDLDQISKPVDMEKPAFKRVQSLLGRVSDSNPDIRFIYTMRRSKQGQGSVWDYEFIVDEAAVDENFNGRIDSFEASEEPGAYYDASGFEEMGKAWLEPAADRDVASDPPHGMLLSGYAPVKDERGVTKAIVGVDILSRTIHAKLAVLRLAISVMGVVIGALLTGLAHMNFKQRALNDTIKRLTLELAQGNKRLLDATTGFVPQVDEP